jgi:hypothetical protein
MENDIALDAVIDNQCDVLRIVRIDLHFDSIGCNSIRAECLSKPFHAVPIDGMNNGR